MVFTFATSSELWGDANWGYGKYPVKLYNSRSVLIHQEDTGRDNSGKKPSGGILSPLNTASSMNETVANPITSYANVYVVINQYGQSGDIYNYYWTSYSRGIDGGGSWGNDNSEPNLHNLYLDSYIPLRHKSIYDPCPYGYRVPSNGTYNEFTSSKMWIGYDYGKGFPWNNTWFVCSGWRLYSSLNINAVGFYVGYFSSTIQSKDHSYVLDIRNGITYKGWGWMKSAGVSVRCIEDCDLLPDQTHSSAGY